jgi:hypothetical protein
MHTPRRATLFAFVLFGLFFTIVPDVLAIVGRPATPVSYAGVARPPGRPPR